MAAKKRRRKRRRSRINPAAVGILAILLIVVIAAAVFLIRKYSPSKELMDLKLYFQLEEEDDLAIIVQNELIEDKGIVLNGRPYVSTEVVKDYLNERFYWDSAENLYIYTTPDEMITAAVGESQYTVDKKSTAVDYQIIKVEDGVAYVALEYIKEHTALDYEYLEEPNRVQITCEYGETTVVDVKRNSEVRYRAGVKSPILTEVKKGDVLYVLEEPEEIEKWTRVRTADGYIGYIRDSKLKDEYTITTSTDFVEPEYSSLTKDYTINLAWHQVTNKHANNTELEKHADAKGLTTISPTWFFI